MTEPTPEAVTETYAKTRDRLIAQVTALADVESLIVPSCPEWTVKDVVAHLSGLIADVLAGVQGPLGSDEATTRQVSTRSDMSLVDVCDEWASNGHAIGQVFVAEPMRGLGLTADLAVHVHDLAEMLDGIDAPPAEATLLGCTRYVPLLQERAAETLDLAVAALLDGHHFAAVHGSTPVTMDGTLVEFLRSVTGRRTRSQVETAFTWEGDPTLLLDRPFTQYGPFRIDPT